MKNDLGFLKSQQLEIPLKELVENAIINQGYEDIVTIIVMNKRYKVSIKDILTPSEHSEVLKLNGYDSFKKNCK